MKWKDKFGIVIAVIAIFFILGISVISAFDLPSLPVSDGNDSNVMSSSFLWIFLIGTAIVVIPSIRIIGVDQIGLVFKRFGRKLPGDDPIAFKGEAGYQAELLMPGIRFKLWILYGVKKHPWVQIPAGEIGVVIAQVGKSLPIGAKSAEYKKEFGNFSNLAVFMKSEGQKGVQRPVLPPGTLVPMHPVAFLVITKRQVYGVTISPDLAREDRISCKTFGLQTNQLDVVTIAPQRLGYSEKEVDIIGIVTTLEGDPLLSGDIANRLGGFDDLREMEENGEPEAKIVETVLGSKNNIHNNFQDFQTFLDNGGKIGLQHDPLLYGAFTLNPFLVSVEIVPMLVVEQGEVAVIKAYVGLETSDTSGEEFKFGSLVKPGHRGIWDEPLRTGKYPINPRCYDAVIVPTAILTLNWAEAVSEAHSLDARLKPIDAKSREGFEFHIDLQVQIHIADTEAPRVISAVGTIENLVDEVLQSAVGNHLRDRIQGMPAITFIETRQQVQEDALAHVEKHLKIYRVETPGVYIQDVVLPPQMVEVLTQREIANQEIATFKKQQESEEQRIAMEQTKGTANMQAGLAKSEVEIAIKTNEAEARKQEADGEATYIKETGAAQAAEVEAVGMAKAKAFLAQVKAIGKTETAIVNALTVLAENNVDIMPDILVAGSNTSSIDGLAATLMKTFSKGSNGKETPADIDIDNLFDKIAKELLPDADEEQITALKKQTMELFSKDESKDTSESAETKKEVTSDIDEIKPTVEEPTEGLKEEKTDKDVK